MSADYYLKMEPVKGESKADKHKEELDILSWGWGASQPTLGHSGGGMGGGKVDVHDMQLSHFLDKSTPMLWSAVSKGTHFPKAILTARKAGDHPLDFLIITLEDVVVSGIQSGGHGAAHGSGDHPTESFSLHFQKFHIKYQEQNASGGVASSPDFKYHIAERKAL
jgi:type VI secretion system secreted protein Hcp